MPLWLIDWHAKSRLFDVFGMPGMPTESDMPPTLLESIKTTSD